LKTLKILDFGLTPYEDALEIQRQCVAEVAEQNLTGIVILLEHPPVYTFGKSANVNNLLASPEFVKNIGASIFKTDRGGDVTFHGPGQLVVYPIINLAYFNLGIRDYVCCLEKSMISVLKKYNIEAGCIDGLTGVWLPANAVSAERKIGAIGVRVSRGITSHGIALNIHTDLSYFYNIIPCGIAGKSVTSMEKELGAEVRFESVKKDFVAAIQAVFGSKIQIIKKEELKNGFQC
jgi:lipoyl(octanoyl) transferase